MSNNLYEKISHGDRKTIVRKYESGTVLSTTTTPPQTIVLKANVALKVTQEYNAYMRTWHDITIHLDNMVETLTERLPPPEPTSIPGRCDHIAAMATDGPCPVCFPRAEVREDRKKPWWRFW
jgi:hypothetical protein